MINIAKWKDEEIDYLKNNYSVLTNEELSDILDKTKDSIRYKASSLGLKKVNIDRIAMFLEDNNYSLLSDEYISAKTPLLIKCNKHNIIKKSNWSDIYQSKFRCEECQSILIRDALKQDYKIVSKEFTKKGLTLLTKSDEYKNNRQKLKCKCNIHNEIEQFISLNSLKNSKIGCKYCARESANEKIRISDDEIIRRCEIHNCTPIDIATYEGVETPMLVRCNVHNCEYYFAVNNYKNTNYPCPECYKESVSMENSHLWKGGITELSAYLRTLLNDWKHDALKKYDYKCCITGNIKNLEIHHAYPFSNIVQDVLEKLNLSVRQNINQYSKSELSHIETEFLKIHKEKHGFPITKELHKKFHSKYGILNFTECDFEEFIRDENIECIS